MSVEISIIICTRNRADMLKKALDSLVHQTLDYNLYEIVIVDNGSTDATSGIIVNFRAENSSHNIVSIIEDRVGLAYARNAGIQKARGSYVGFIDDDARASANWLETALICFNNVQPAPLGIGGLILPFYESHKPKWFKDEYEIRSWGEQPRFLKQGESFSGSNMIFRKETFDIYGGFDVSMGVKGEYLSLGEETSLFDKIWQDQSSSCLLYYVPQLVVLHAVPTYKMTVKYALKRAFATGQAMQVIRGADSLRDRLKPLPVLLFGIIKSSVFALRRFRNYHTYQNWIVEDVAPVVLYLGDLAGYLGIFLKMKQG